MLEVLRGLQIEGGAARAVEDTLAAEHPLQVTVNGTPFTVTMRTPGDDRLLVRGLLHTEGVVADRHAEIRWTPGPADPDGAWRSLDARIDPALLAPGFPLRRSLLSTSSCGICGTTDVADTAAEGAALAALAPDERLDPAAIPGILETMRRHQIAFDGSGGTHAAALFDATGAVLVVHEDIGRHNAVDKAVGWMLEQPSGARARGLAVSGRLSYEIVRKAWRAGLPVVLAVSAPSSLAVHTAERLGISVLAFCREGRATIYSRAGNVRLPEEALGPIGRMGPIGRGE
ncbi:MAG: formate dehydrogenase accessory sulfurtransferase FdhD [Candidatus Sumerlaeia bacterium]|nr:formate dehydrogenase accessory sulfurtransferase FdhD [Candidatus Sumerlaeia bacterium]